MNRSQDTNGAGNASEQWKGLVLSKLYTAVNMCNRAIPYMFTVQLSKLLSGYQISNDDKDGRLIRVMLNNGDSKISKGLSLSCRMSLGACVDLSDIMLSVECIELDEDVISVWQEALEMTVDSINDLFSAEMLRLFPECGVGFEEIFSGCLKLIITGENGAKIMRYISISTY